MQSKPLEQFNRQIGADVNLDEFLNQGYASQGPMAGAARLPWPNDLKQELGLKLALVIRFSEDPEFLLVIAHNFYFKRGGYTAEIHNIVEQLITPFCRDYFKAAFMAAEMLGQRQTELGDPDNKTIFVVHGHDEHLLAIVLRFLEKSGFEPIVLHEQANRGRTIIRKFEEESARAAFAVVLLTPDDFGGSNRDRVERARARQNVVFEFGYMLGQLGAGRVVALKKSDVERPSDLDGVLYIDVDKVDWQRLLAREIRAAGLKFDSDALL